MPEKIIDPEIVTDTGPAKGKKARATDTELLGKKDQEAVDAMESVLKENPNILMALFNKIKSNPTLSIMGEKSAHSAKMAAKARAGRVLLGRIRNNLIRPMLPEQHRGVMDNVLVCAVIDLIIGHGMLFVGVEFQDKLPKKLQPYALAIGEACMYSGYTDTFGSFDFEDIFLKLMSGDLFDTFKGFVDSEAA
jgi:hypothetical protein